VSLVSSITTAPADAIHSESKTDSSQQQTPANSPAKHGRECQQGSAATEDRVLKQASGPKPPSMMTKKRSSMKPHVVALLVAAVVLATACAGGYRVGTDGAHRQDSTGAVAAVPDPGM
jgi:hypothetical protein